MVGSLLMLVALAGPSTLTAQPSPSPRQLTDELVRPGWLGFGLFLLLVIACIFLFRSMNRQLKKVDFDEEPLDEERLGQDPPNEDPTEQAGS